MSNTSDQDPNSNQNPNQDYGNIPPQPPYSGPPQEYTSSPPNYYQPPYAGPPQGYQGQYGYGANPEYDLNRQGGYNNLPIAPASTPLPLGEAIRQLPSQYVRVLTRPGAAAFVAEKGKAAWNIVWVQIIALTVLTVLFGFAFLNFTFPASLTTRSLSSNPASTYNPIEGFRQSFGFLPLSYIILTPLGLFISLGIYHLIAKAFGGTGTFKAYMYSYLLFGVPLTTIALLLTLIPLVGGIIASVVSIYTIVLQIFMTMAVHRLSGGKATFAVLLLPIIGIVLGIIGGIILVAVIVTALQHVR